MFTKKETNFCKGIAILLMLFHHLFNDYEEYAGYVVSFSPLNAERVRFYAVLGKICVAMFVFLSGYGIAATWRKKFAGKPSRKEVFTFTWNRLWKLMTVYWFAFLLTLLCQPLGRTVFDAYGRVPKDIAAFLTVDFFGLAHMFGTPTLNPTWWYMSLAISIILLMPLVLRLMDEVGALPVLGGSVVLLFFLDARNANTFYLFSMVLGAACFEARLFDRLGALWSSSRFGTDRKAVLELAALLVLLAFRSNYNYYGIVDGLIAMVIAMLVSTVLIRIPVVTGVMQLLGRHSANMFLVHNQIYSFYFLGLIYSFGHWLLILAVLTAVSLLVSIAMELLKKYTGYQKLLGRAGQRLLQLFACTPPSDAAPQDAQQRS